MQKWPSFALATWVGTSGWCGAEERGAVFTFFFYCRFGKKARGRPEGSPLGCGG